MIIGWLIDWLTDWQIDWIDWIDWLIIDNWSFYNWSFDNWSFSYWILTDWWLIIYLLIRNMEYTHLPHIHDQSTAWVGTGKKYLLKIVFWSRQNNVKNTCNVMLSLAPGHALKITKVYLSTNISTEFLIACVLHLILKFNEEKGQVFFNTRSLKSRLNLYERECISHPQFILICFLHFNFISFY